MKEKKLKFVSETQERIFKFLLKIAQNIPADVYKQYESEAKQVIELPAIRAEYAATETFKSIFVSTPTNFQAKAEFYLKTVFFKLEPGKIETLFKLANAMKSQQDSEKPVHPFSFLIAAMNFEPDARQYVSFPKKEKEEKMLKSIDWNTL
jgi:hypothetical protein